MDNVYEIAKRFDTLDDKSKLKLLDDVNTVSELRILGLIATINGKNCIGDRHRYSRWLSLNLQDGFNCERRVEASICLDCGRTTSKF